MNVAEAGLVPLPRQPEGTPWPTHAWPEGALPESADLERLDALTRHAFESGGPEDLGETHAFLLVHRGRLVHERYAAGYGPEMTYPSWSMAKSITHALAGILVRDGQLDIFEPAGLAEWQGDERATITMDHLLRMSSGLAFREDYVDNEVSDVIEMLFGDGKSDVAGFAASFPLEHRPGTFWSYSSGTTNIVSRVLSERSGVRGAAFEAFMRRTLFDPLGMTSAIPKFDEKGTFIGSSFCFCTARDFARFGLLYLRGGVWEGRPLLPPGWVDYARRPTPQPPGEPLGYGAHWWLGLGGPHSFSANGYQGQYTVLCPDTDLILVRHGDSLDESGEAVKRWIGEIADCFRS